MPVRMDYGKPTDNDRTIYCATLFITEQYSRIIDQERLENEIYLESKDLAMNFVRLCSIRVKVL